MLNTNCWNSGPPMQTLHTFPHLFPGRICSLSFIQRCQTGPVLLLIAVGVSRHFSRNAHAAMYTMLVGGGGESSGSLRCPSSSSSCFESRTMLRTRNVPGYPCACGGGPQSLGAECQHVLHRVGKCSKADDNKDVGQRASQQAVPLVA